MEAAVAAVFEDAAAQPPPQALPPPIAELPPSDGDPIARCVQFLVAAAVAGRSGGSTLEALAKTPLPETREAAIAALHNIQGRLVLDDTLCQEPRAQQYFLGLLNALSTQTSRALASMGLTAMLTAAVTSASTAGATALAPVRAGFATLSDLAGGGGGSGATTAAAKQAPQTQVSSPASIAGLAVIGVLVILIIALAVALGMAKKKNGVGLPSAPNTAASFGGRQAGFSPLEPWY